LSAFNDNFFRPELTRRPGSGRNSRKTHVFVPGAKFGCFRLLVGRRLNAPTTRFASANTVLTKPNCESLMKMTHVRWSVVVPVLMMVGWLSLYVMIFIEIGFL
jgi:hypothetical protein